MASCRRLANLRRRLVSQICRTSDPTKSIGYVAPSLTLRRYGDGSAYDKNVDDQLNPTVVPDDEIQHPQSDKYWAPSPNTGVFTPAKDQHIAEEGESDFDSTDAGDTTPDSVLEQKAFFRPLEDLEIPQQHLIEDEDK